MSALTEVAGLALCAALLLTGVLTALTAASIMKRIAGVFVALIAAAMAGATFGAPKPLVMAAVVMIAAYVAIGAAVLVRLQESYGGSDAPAIDATDAQGEPGRDV